MPISVPQLDLNAFDRPSTIPTGVVQTTVETLGADIVRRVYGAEITLLVESELAERLSVGRNALREAIKVLAVKVVVRTARRYGTKVCAPSEWNMLDADLSNWLSIDAALVRQFMFDVIEARRFLEPQAAALAASRANEREVHDPLETARLLAGEDVEMVVKADILFHVRLNNAALNSVLRQFGRAIGSLLNIYFRIGVHEAGSYTPNPEGHLLIAEAVAERNGRLVRDRPILLLESNRKEAETLTGNRIGGSPG